MVRDGMPFEMALDREARQLPEADRRLAHELAAGVLRQRSRLDAQLAPLVSRGWTRVAPHLQDILRLGAYQLTTLERVPAHAAVDTSVSLAKTRSGIRAAGFVNAILRGLTRSEGREAITAESQDALTLAEEYSHPAWLVHRWFQHFGAEETKRLLLWNNTRPKLVIQPAREELPSIMAGLRSAGIEAEVAPYGAGLIVSAMTRPAELPGYREGAFVVQNAAQGLLARFAGFPAESQVYDVCAAPGGKTIALGRTTRMVAAGDVSRSRAERLRNNLARAGSGREYTIVADGRLPPIRHIDGVVLDVPCLGTGTFARHPDARWRVTPEALVSLVRLQGELLEAAATIVKANGLLVYSTCSLEPEENRVQVDRFLENHPEFVREATTGFPGELFSAEGDLMVLPQRHGTDGAYAARLRRSA
jgi:16S rRNA (cytosine967-C5)-methyltransferase